MKADIISIGDELLIGQTVNTNASWLGKELGSRGIRIMQVTAIPDDEAKIIEAFDEAFRRSEIIIVTGGLGPTKDDITKHTLCKYFKTHLVMHEPTREKIHSFFERRNRPMLDVNTRQAELPASCEILKNDYGTASGMWFEDEKGILVSLPGVPYEMKGIVSEEVIPRLEQRYELKSLYHVTLMTQGLGESFLADRISDWEDRVRDAGLGLAYLPSPGLVKLRLTSYEGASREQEIRNYFSELEARLPNNVFGYDDATLPEVLGQLLRSGSYTIGTVESCTAGNIAGSISSVSGASDYFMGSLITYSNAMKIQLAGVRVEHHVFDNRAKARRGSIDFGFGLRIKVAHFLHRGLGIFIRREEGRDCAFLRETEQGGASASHVAFTGLEARVHASIDRDGVDFVFFQQALG